MLYDKKTRLLRRLFSKEKSSNKGRDDKCHYHRLDDPAHHSQQQHHNGPGSKNEFPLFQLADKCLTSVENQTLPNSVDSNKSNLSALLAAKLSCDEWGIQRRQNIGEATSTKKISVPQLSTNLPSSPSTKPKAKIRVIQVRNGNLQHPSYKPPTHQRSPSMKERREAKENSKKLGRFTSSLYCIHELPENGPVSIH